MKNKGSLTGNSVVVITGFMGSGKTVLAEALARQMNCSAIDLDRVITDKEGVTPGELIRQCGEDSFRHVESRVLKEVLETISAGVIALGGGTWTISENRELIRRKGCFTVWLDAPFELCWMRILSSGNERPLAPDEQRARSLYEYRQPIYKLVKLRVPVTEGRSIEDIAADVLHALEGANL
jgi:shikimate kinase